VYIINITGTQNVRLENFIYLLLQEATTS